FQPLSELPCAESDSDQSEDSDAEFLVHPILRSLIKSKSAYTVTREMPRLKTSKTAFEINLSRMWESTAEDEAPVADFTPDLDQKWPEPDSPSPPMKLYFPPHIRPRSPLLRKTSCWSSPANVYMDGLTASNSPIDPDRSSCWSAPECLDDSGSDEYYEDEEHIPRSCSCHELDHGVDGKNPSLLDSCYPMIDSTKQVPSLCSIRLPSSSGTTANSPSPPRPLSPVLGRPPIYAKQISGSRSMQLRPRPELSSFVDNSTSDDDSPQQDPWPLQEVWPEEHVMTRSLRTGWTATDSAERIQRPQSSRTVSDDVRHVGVSGSRSMHTQLHYVSSQVQGSSSTRLDDAERRDLITRSAWIDRGSTVQLQDRASERRVPEIARPSGLRNGARCESQADFRTDTESADFMRRSYTTEELKRERRRLPKRPDVQPFLSELPSSLPLHGQAVEDLGEPHQDDLSMREGDARYYSTEARPAEHQAPKAGGAQRLHMTSEDYELPTPVTESLSASGRIWNNRLARGMHQSEECGNLETRFFENNGTINFH
ncbi:hypothetical protein GCK32_010071, partial [Trichostrongylus colubriformis]